MLSSCELVLKTANHIERNPRSYRYTINRIPRCLNDTGCILGWMAHFACERDHGWLTSQIIARITCDPVYACNVEYNDFFKRLDECYPIHRGHWRSDAKHAVAALRAYAAQYPEAPALPVWARMRDREAAAAQQGYARFRARLALPGSGLWTCSEVTAARTKVLQMIPSCDPTGTSHLAQRTSSR